MVDLTPMLLGGANGGAKLFVIELLKHLATLANHSELILLCRAETYEELATLESHNVRRVQMASPTTASKIKSTATSSVRSFIKFMPEGTGRVLESLVLKFTATFRRHSFRSISQELKGDLLYCPFTAPYFHDDQIPTICTVYDLQYKIYPEFFRPEEIACRDSAFTDACNKATKLTTISEFSRQEILNYGKVAPSRVHLIYLRLGQRLLSAQSKGDAEIFNNLHITPQRYLLYPANFWKHKNHEILFTAFGMACAQGLPGDIKLVCTGAPGERQAGLLQTAIGFGLGERIVFPGYLPDFELTAIMANACGVVFPSLYEGFGMPVVEAMAAGVPVACSNTTALPEVVADAAILFNPERPNEIAQALLTLVMDQPVRNHCINAGKVRAAEFSNSYRMAEEYLELFEFVIAANKKPDRLC